MGAINYASIHEHVWPCPHRYRPQYSECRTCGGEFFISAGEVSWCDLLRYPLPTRCDECCEQENAE